MKNLECFYVLGQNVGGGVDLAISYRVCEWMSYKESKKLFIFAEIPHRSWWYVGILPKYLPKIWNKVELFCLIWGILARFAKKMTDSEELIFSLTLHSMLPQFVFDFTPFLTASMCWNGVVHVHTVNVLGLLGLAWPRTVVPKG